jgi:hypothetical protein
MSFVFEKMEAGDVWAADDKSTEPLKKSGAGPIKKNGACVGEKEKVHGDHDASLETVAGDDEGKQPVVQTSTSRTIADANTFKRKAREYHDDEERSKSRKTRKKSASSSARRGLRPAPPARRRFFALRWR